MRRRATCSIAVVILLISSSPVLAQLEQVRPPDLPSDRNVIAFTNRAEGAMLSRLRDATPIIEGYFQRFIPTEKLGYAIDSDRYILGRFKWTYKPEIEDLLNYEASGDSHVEKQANDQQLLNGLLDVMEPDWNQLRADRYEYKFVKLTFLGAIRCLVYDVKPLNLEDEGFRGRIYLEDKSWNLVRFTGMNTHFDAAFAAMRGSDSRFRIDTWRVNVAKDHWATAYVYVEEVAPLGSPELPRFRGQIRIWGYDRTDDHHQEQFTGGVLNESSSTSSGPKGAWPSPQQSQRLFEHQAEEIVLARLHQGRFLGTTGDVEKKLDQVVKNLLVSNKILLGEPVHCRILLTLPFEAFIVGNTIIISRGLIDSVPSESALALVLAHQIAHFYLGHSKIDSNLAFADVLDITDNELLAKLRFRHSVREEAAADAKAMEILELSPYNNRDSMSDAGLFMQALQAHMKQLPNLVRPTFGEDIADVEHTVRNNTMYRTTPLLDDELADQTGALPLGSKLLVNPWDGRVELLQSEPVPVPTTRERYELAVTPIMPFLDYFAEMSNVPKPSESAKQQGARRDASVTRRSVPAVQKRMPHDRPTKPAPPERTSKDYIREGRSAVPSSGTTFNTGTKNATD